ncbi:unnamed protein product [Euphydryas editha]|uniref:Uncharacterized protein n=1 Tax=Euphydryas editha TaxID=104508 RepID=A0AAU9TJJ6_EUPED|nr:unnamed protein product [Euphydryas editha]
MEISETREPLVTYLIDPVDEDDGQLLCFDKKMNYTTIVFLEIMNNAEEDLLGLIRLKVKLITHSAVSIKQMGGVA